jgi:hypothetical protein
VTAGGRRREPRLDQRDDLRARTLCRQRLDQRLALHLRQITQQLDKCPEILRFHGVPAARN